MSVTQQDDELSPMVINQPASVWGIPNVAEMWRYRGLLWEMTYSDLRARYRQTIMGLLWAVVNPLITVAVYTFVFNRVVGIETEVPYALFVFTGLSIWIFFARALGAASGGVVAYSGILAKVYFPRIFAPISKMFVGLIDFVIALVMLLIMLLLFGESIDVKILMLPVFILMAIFTALGGGLWLSALNVRFRDISYILPYFIQLMQFLTPVIYPSDLLSGTARIIYSVNPMASVCDGFRWALLDMDTLHPESLAVSMVACVVILISGLVFFHRLEKSFPDLV